MNDIAVAKRLLTGEIKMKEHGTPCSKIFIRCIECEFYSERLDSSGNYAVCMRDTAYISQDALCVEYIPK
jgi:hypothetical protein